MKFRSRALTVCSLVIGLALFILVIRKTGWHEIAERVRALGAGFLLILLISAVRQMARTLAWLCCLTPADRTVGLLALLKARLAGDAIGDLTTAGPLIAEPLKVVTLGDRLSIDARIASLAVENLAYAVSSCVLLLAGTIALLAFFTVDDSLRLASLIALGIVVLVLVGSIVVVRARVPLLSGLSTVLLCAIGRETQWQARLTRLREQENYVFDFYSQRPLDFLLVAGCEISFHAAGVLEVFMTLYLIGSVPTLVVAFILETVNRAINIVFAFVPAMIGVDEAGTGLLAGTLGLGTTAGVTVALVRKARMFFWIVLGLIFLAVRRKERRKAEGEQQRATARVFF